MIIQYLLEVMFTKFKDEDTVLIMNNVLKSHFLPKCMFQHVYMYIVGCHIILSWMLSEIFYIGYFG